MTEDSEAVKVQNPDPRETYWNEEWLREKYWDKELSQAQIADLAGVGRSTIQRWMDKLDVERRAHTSTSEDPEIEGWLRATVSDGLSNEERLALRDRHEELLSSVHELNRERRTAVESLCEDMGLDYDDIGDRIEARQEFRETEFADKLDERMSRVISRLAEMYSGLLENRFEDPQSRKKKEQIGLIKTTFGDDAKDRSIMEATEASRRYVKDFTAFAEVEIKDSRLGPASYYSEGFEQGEPAVVLQRYQRQQNRMSSSLRNEVLERDDRECLRCGSKKELQVHHITPVSRGGSHRKENLATLCADCNNNARLVNTFYGEEIPVYPLGRFEDWVNGDLNICGAITNDMTPCENPEGSCPHHH